MDKLIKIRWVRWSTAVIAAVAAFGLLACGTGQPAGGPAETSSPEPVTESADQGVAGGQDQSQALYPFTFTDDGGVEVTIEREPMRIASIGPSNTEILFALGLGDRVVGVDSYSDYPEEALEKTDLGSVLEPSLETLVALEPDLVFLLGRNRSRGEMEELGLTTLEIDPDNLDAIYDRIELIGRITNRQEAAADIVAQMKQRVAAVEAVVAQVPEAERVRAYYEVWHDPLMAIGRGSYMHDILVRAGGINIFADVEASSAEVDPETVISRNPEVIIVTHQTQSVADLEAGTRPAWADVAAVRDGRIHYVDTSIIGHRSPRLVEGLETVARLLYPELFEERGSE